MLHWFITTLVLLTFSSCETTEISFTKGIQDSYAGFVPARIAVLPCRMWPNVSKFAGLPIDSSDKKLRKKICEDIDTFVLEGFKEQPFMRGYSPKAINKLLTRADSTDFLKQFDSKWAKSPKDCIECRDEGAFYQRSVADRPEWRLWLSELSKKTRHVDAVLVPFFVFASEAIHDDRGLYRYERAVRASLLLIDAANGHLIWFGYRIGRTANHKLVERSKKQKLSPPKWDTAINQTLMNDMWDEFPGRQYY